ncbi:TPA: hypothetical protein RXK12_001672, partial [Campylobacter jejuni]|nr:hypothetical protein [Campylobacter jejuni]
ASVYQNTNTTISNSQTSTQTISGTNNTLVIETGGTITISNSSNQAVNFTQGSSTTTFLNKGTLIGGSNTASVQLGANNQNGVTIETFNNQGIIGNGSSKFGVTVWGKDDSKSTITNFNNKGTIHSNAGEAVYFSNSEVKTFKNEGTISSNFDKGINISSNVTIDKFENTGIINSIGTITSTEGYTSGSVNIIGSDSAKVSIKTFNNTGTITSQETHGVNLRHTTIDNFTNSGLIKTDGTKTHTSDTRVDSGFRTTNVYIKTLENTGTISGFAGVLLNGSTIDQFTNKGTIVGTQDSAKSVGIMVGGIINTGSTLSTIKQLDNEGIITSKGHGVIISNGSKIETLTNKGTIEASLNGIMFHNYKDIDKETDLGKITLDTNSVIKAGNNAIHIDGSDKDITAEGIDLKDKALLDGGNAGIYIGGGKNLKTSINVAGTIQGGNGGIINTGTIGQKGQTQQQHGITIDNGGLITSKNGSGILNTDNGIIYGNIVNKSSNNLSLKNDSSATITSGVKNEGSGTIFVNNQGTISKDNQGNNLTNSGSGSIVI